MTKPKVEATMLAIVTADLYVDNIGYNNSTLIEASEYARKNWTPELEDEASLALTTFRTIDDLESFNMSDANILVFTEETIYNLIRADYPLLDAYLEKCFEEMSNV